MMGARCPPRSEGPCLNALGLCGIRLSRRSALPFAICASLPEFVIEPPAQRFDLKRSATGEPRSLPELGSYMTQCKNANMAGPILRASCKASDGSRVDTTINMLDCRGRDIGVK